MVIFLVFTVHQPNVLETNHATVYCLSHSLLCHGLDYIPKQITPNNMGIERRYLTNLNYPVFGTHCFIIEMVSALDVFRHQSKFQVYFRILLYKL